MDFDTVPKFSYYNLLKTSVIGMMESNFEEEMQATQIPQNIRFVKAVRMLYNTLQEPAFKERMENILAAASILFEDEKNNVYHGLDELPHGYHIYDEGIKILQKAGLIEDNGDITHFKKTPNGKKIHYMINGLITLSPDRSNVIIVNGFEYKALSIIHELFYTIIEEREIPEKIIQILYNKT